MKKLIDLINKLLVKGFEAFGKYYSTYRGIVVDRDDPKGLQRVRVIIPEIYGDAVSNWMSPQSVFSGKNYGAQAIPQKQSLVTITFEYGDPRRPRWAHGYFGTVDGESELDDEELKNPDSYWFRTPQGLTIQMTEDPDDEENNLIKLVHPNGNEIQIDNLGIHFKRNDDGLINLGRFEEAEQWAIKGDIWKEKQEELINHISAITVSTAFGPSSIPINISDFVDDLGNLELPLSDNVKLD